MTSELTETYAEEMGEQAFDWNRALDLAIAARVMHTDAYLDLCDRATSWITCACGNQCAAIPRDPEGTGMPVDPWLTKLGLKFACQVVDQEWLGAKATLLAIESRAKELLSEL